MLTVQRVYELIDALAPFDTQADFDNSGLLVGNPQAEVTGIHLALDVTCLLYTSPSPRDRQKSRMPSSA